MKADLETVRDLLNPEIEECPYCGCDTFYYKQRMSGCGQMYARYDGKEVINSDMHEGLKYTAIGKFAYCADCGKGVFRFKK